MNNFNELKSLWQQQAENTAPSPEEISTLARKAQKRMMGKNLLSMSLLGLSVIIISSIITGAQFRYASTKLGALLIILAILGFIFLSSQLLRIMLRAADITLTNEAYLKQLLRYQRKERFIQTKGMTAYYFLLSVGLAVYMYEFYARDHVFGLVAYGVTFAWIAVNWFYLLPRSVRKQEKKLNDLIGMIQSISKQLQEGGNEGGL
jgi:hypothetical protein